MAITSVRMKSFAPTNVGTRSRGFSFMYSGSLVGGLVVTNSISRLFSFARTRRTVERAFPYRERSTQVRYPKQKRKVVYGCREIVLSPEQE